MSPCQCTVTPPSPAWKIVVYPASLNLHTDKSEFAFNSGNMSRSRACLLRLGLGRSAFFVVLVSCPFGMLTCLLDGLPVGMFLSCSCQKLEVAAESNTADALRSRLFLILRAHLAAILLLIGGGYWICLFLSSIELLAV